MKIDAANTVDLTKLRDDAKREIDKRADETRHHKLTRGDAQQLEYEKTRHEALAIATDDGPQDADYPMLAAERDAQQRVLGNGATLTSVGQEIRDKIASWEGDIGDAIKRERRAAKMAIDNAQDPPSIEDAKQAGFDNLNSIW